LTLFLNWSMPPNGAAPCRERAFCGQESGRSGRSVQDHPRTGRLPERFQTARGVEIVREEAALRANLLEWSGREESHRP